VAVTVAMGQTSPVALVAILLVARISEGASAACAVPTTLVLLSRATDTDPVRRMRVMGLFEVTSLVGMIVGFVVAGIGWEGLGARAFLLLAPIYVGAWLLVGRPAREEV
jgi:MFS family permease